MQVVRCLHTAVMVTDLDRAAHFYGTVLGLALADRPLNFPGLWYAIGDHQLHIMTAPAVHTELENPENWGRNRHLALAVADFDAMKAHLEAENYPIRMSASGRQALFVKDPDGNLVELQAVV